MNGRNLKITKITCSITEDPDTPEEAFQKCPVCGAEFALVDKDSILCSNPSCKHYNAEFVTTIKDAAPQTYWDIRSHLRGMKSYRLIGKKGSVVLKSVRQRAETSNKKYPRDYSAYVDKIDFLGDIADEIAPPIEFDDLADQGHYFVLFVKLPSVEKTLVYRSYKYLGKYISLEWRWPSPNCNHAAGEHGAWGDAILTRTHHPMVCTKDYIAKMYLNGEEVDPRTLKKI
jgi:hypothetical protein